MTEHFAGTSIDNTTYCIVINERPGTNDDFAVVLASGNITSMTNRKGENMNEVDMQTYTELISNLGYGQFTGKLFIQVV